MVWTITIIRFHCIIGLMMLYGCSVKSLQPKKKDWKLLFEVNLFHSGRMETGNKGKKISRWWLWICDDDMIRVVGAVFAPYGSVAAGISLGFRWDFCVQPQPSSCWNKVLTTKHKKWLTNLQHVQFITGNWKLKGFFVQKNNFLSTFHPLSIHFPSDLPPRPW